MKNKHFRLCATILAINEHAFESGCTEFFFFALHYNNTKELTKFITNSGLWSSEFFVFSHFISRVGE